MHERWYSSRHVLVRDNPDASEPCLRMPESNGLAGEARLRGLFEVSAVAPYDRNMTEEQNPREKPKSQVPKNLKQYYLGLLRRGPQWNVIDDRAAQELLPQHLAYLRKQTEEGRYLFAGPVNEEAEYVGMMMIAAGSKEEALAAASGDPGVIARRLSVEVYPVYLPALDGVQVRYS